MKTDTLVKLIRQLVKEEVAAEVNKAMGKVLVEMIKEIKSPVSNTSEPFKTKTIRTSNPKLNSVLEETARNFKPLAKTDDSRISMSDLLEDGFEKIGQNELVEVAPTLPAADGTKIGFLKSIITESSGTPSVLDKGADVPDMLKKVFKKDFRAVMRAIDEKKKMGGAGLIDSGKIISG